MDGYPLEWGWHTPPTSGSGEPPAWKPTPTLLGGADPDSFASDEASGPTVQVAQADEPVPRNKLIAYQRYPAESQRVLPNDTHMTEEEARVEWRLEEPSVDGGVIVQEVNHTAPDGKVHTYWEAWTVEPGKDRTTHHPLPDDTFRKVKPNGIDFSPGVHHLRTEARFYEGTRLPEAFQPNNQKVRSAGRLPATDIDPRLPAENATAPLRRTWSSPP